ncbi:MAG: ribonuclease catalytic domain-containing protein [Desulfococcaceae bacterium]
MEYIDRQKIVCAAVLEIKNERLRLLTENNREVKLSAARLSHRGKMSVNLSAGRDKASDSLKERANRRKSLAGEIDIRELWEVLSPEQEWIDLQTMTAFCFPDSPTDDHESAVIRALFADRLYFRFNQDQFFPHTEEQVEQINAKAREEARKQRITENGGDWIKSVLSGKDTGLLSAHPQFTEEQQDWIRILQSYYLFEKESPQWELGRDMLARAGITDIGNLFHFFVKLGIWNPDENIDLHRYGVPTDFPEKLMECIASRNRFFEIRSAGSRRRDLTGLPIITIDGQATLDFDDALSLERKEDHYVLGVHIADVGHFVEKGSPLDREAVQRGSSIYMPDRKISMLPQCLAEDQCSLKAGELRPATSTLIRLRPSGDIISSEICSSIIRVSRQLTYHEVNCMVEEDGDIAILYDIARQFRKRRLADRAVQISLPEINIWLDERGELTVTRINRESPGRMLVAEIMIMANWLNARFLAENRLPAIFRSQPAPRERLYKEDEGSLFQNWMQRKLLSRFVLSTEPEPHSGLGLDAYVTVTSPIRKYSDLITQRQIRAVFGLDTPYSSGEVQQTIHALEYPMSCVSKLQNRRKHYWLLKYLEGKTGQKEEAIVLGKRRNTYQVLMTEYMIECTIPAAGGMNLKPEDVIQVTIQHVDARKEILNVFMG